jgi:hypothetical protein
MSGVLLHLIQSEIPLESLIIADKYLTLASVGSDVLVIQRLGEKNWRKQGENPIPERSITFRKSSKLTSHSAFESYIDALINAKDAETTSLRQSHQHR